MRGNVYDSVIWSLFYLIYESESNMPRISASSPFPPLAHLPLCSGSECSRSARPQRLHVVLMIMDNYDGKLCKASQGGVSPLKSKGLTSTGLGFHLGVKQNWETLVETLEIRGFLERFVLPRQLQVQIIHFL